MKNISVNLRWFSVCLTGIVFFFLSACKDEPPGEVERINSVLASGDWAVTHLFNDSNQTIKYKDYILRFADQQALNVTTTNGTLQGEWSVRESVHTYNRLVIVFSDSTIALGGDWRIIDYTPTDFRLEGSQVISGVSKVKKFTMTKILP